MKKYFIFLLLLLVIPIINVNAREFFNSLKDSNVFLKDDVIHMYAYDVDEFNIHIDGEVVLTDDENPIVNNIFVYTVPKTIILDSYEYDYSGKKADYYFSTYEIKSKIHCNKEEEHDAFLEFDESLCDDYVTENSYYKGGELIQMYNFYQSFYLYGINKDPIDYINNYLIPLPELEENQYWKVSSIKYNGYESPSPVLEKITYEAPKFELSCTPKSIYYGEKATCTLSVNSPYKLSELSFDLENEAFKVLGVTLPKGVEKVEGNREYNLEFGKDYDQSNHVVMNFDISGLKNANYEDNLKVVNIDYVDEVVMGAYSELDGSLEIKTYNGKNPNTASKILPVPIVIAAFAAVLYFFSEMSKKRSTN